MDTNQITETIKSSFIYNFRTGNVMLDTILTGLIIMFTTHIVNMLTGLLNTDFRSWYEKFKGNDARIIITGKKVQGMHSTRLEYSTNFFAVLHQIKKLNCVDANIFQLSEVPIQEPDEARYNYQEAHDSWSDDESDEIGGEADNDNVKGMKTNLIVSQSHPFRLSSKVWGKVNIMQNDDNNEKNPMKTEEFQVTIGSECMTAEELRQLLNVWVREYHQYLNADKHLRYFVYTPPSDSSQDYYDATAHYSEFRFESGKSFENIFFPEKDDIVKRINYFNKNKNWYKERGIPYTMGFLFYGEPGCGKTSTIKAIANHTDRHIVAIPLNKIKTGKELLNVFYNTKMNHKDIPLHKRLYVLEDIDCADLKDIVGDRDKSEEDSTTESTSNSRTQQTNNNDDENNFDILSLLKVSSATAAWDKKANKLTLATLLEVLDGVMEMEGRMLIITTNYPEKLDKALIRPGRIDLKVKFNKCTKESLIQMYQHYFTKELPAGFDPASLPDNEWTPAEATQVFLNNMFTPEQSLDTLAAPKSKKGSFVALEAE
eukprot:TRINITY_DN3672_c0_g1_i6.p1 TRINITY_DN3672_c0_g1~~TRINITY_DN3672_c0_g1_i6.p1  ORF type:complete len:542 (-),score=211.02 TRINITY_DN3672_c0_g1_i6:97-1722(-)